jgi:adenylate kinase family enzyme
MGPPGCKRHDFAEGLAEYFQWEFIQTGDALRAEAKKSTPNGERIKKCLLNNECVDDDIVVDIVTKKI